MKIKKSKVYKASKKHKNKNGGGGKFTLKPLPQTLRRSSINDLDKNLPNYNSTYISSFPQQLMRSPPQQRSSPRPLMRSPPQQRSSPRPLIRSSPRPLIRSSPRPLIRSSPRQRSPSIYPIIHPDLDKNLPNYNPTYIPSLLLKSNSNSHHGSPKATSNHGSPKATSNHGSPKLLSRHSSPKLLSRHSSPKVLSRHSSPKATSNHGSPKVLSRHSSPKVIANQGIIIKRPILSYDKVNQRHLLIDLKNCNEEYTDRLKKYNYDLKHNTKRWHEDIYQYGSSFKRIIRFARELLNTGNNLLQDDNVIAKKTELKRMLDNFEAYLNELNEINKVKRAIKPNNIIDNDQIFHTDLKVTLDMTKEIVNKLNALYGSTLRQSYLRKIANIGEKMGRIPEKIRDVATSFNQYNFRDLFKQETYTDDMRHGIMIGQYYKRMATRPPKMFNMRR
jgi:flagellin-specific chaperone FliS